MTAAQFTRPNLIKEFGDSLIEDRVDRVGEAADKDLKTLAQNLPSGVSAAILGARQHQLDEVNDTFGILSGCQGEQTVARCLGTGRGGLLIELAEWGCPRGVEVTVAECRAGVDAERQRLVGLADEARALAGSVGGVPDPTGSERDRLWQQCQAAGPTSEACRRLFDSGTYRPDARDTSSSLERACVQRGGVMIGGQCVGVNPYSGFNSGLGGLGQQQCSGIQQMLSLCRNPYTGQQQCTGVALMTNNCPQGSYNPNNPNNPNNYPAPTCNIQVNPTTTSAPGQPATLTWQSQNAQYASLSNTGQIGPQGTMTVYPQGPTTYVMNVTGYGNQQGQCQAQFGQGTGGTGQPQAQISCQPQTADVGMEVAISWACQNSSAGAGSGFSTGGALSGSATTTLSAPPAGQHSVTYGLTCVNQGVTHNAQCTVNVNKTAIVLVANPKTVDEGEESNIGWVTSGMDSCVISSPDLSDFTEEHADSTNPSGAVKTGELTEDADFVLTCETKTGLTKTATTTVTVDS